MTEYDKAQMRRAMLESLRVQGAENEAAQQTERSTRTRGERRRLAQRNAPRGLTPGSVLTAPGVDRSGGRNWRLNPSFQEWDRLTDEQYRLRQQTYGADEGYARGLARSLREQGVTPLSMAMMARGLPAAAMGITSPQQLMQGGY